MFLAKKLNKGGSLGGYQISRSLRFNRYDGAYLQRAPATNTNQKTWTYSGWVKRSEKTIDTANSQHLMRTDTNATLIRFDANVNRESLRLYGVGGTLDLVTSALYRDFSAWYHIVVAVDTTQATASNRAKLYVNGSQITALHTASYPAQNSDTGFNTTASQFIGCTAGFIEFYDGYMTEVNFVDGSQLTPSSFGETNAQTGVWQPKAYSGSYGTNGFYLNFSDNSNTTAATLGKDYSGNGNNWTPNNFSVTAGAGNDSLVDSPTSYGTDTGVGGTVRGNYATLNPLALGAGTLSNGNLDFIFTGGGFGSKVSTIGVTSGKWYCESTVTSLTIGGNGLLFGVSSITETSSYLGSQSTSYGYYANSGDKYNNGASSAYGATLANNDVVGIALDLDAGTLTFYKNGTSQGTAFSSLPSGTWYFGASSTNSATVAMNFGQRPFAYTAPSGFKALCTQNLPTPTIGATTATQAGKFFNTILWSGAGSGTTRSLTGVGFQPDWVWTKSRNGGYQHEIYDVIRGASNITSLSSNSTNSEALGNVALYGYVSSFDSDGFTGTNGTDVTIPNAYFNQSGQNYVAWNWKANGSGSTNTAGSITSTVSANTTSGFSVVTYTGNGNNSTVGHGLGIAPSMVIIKSRSAVQVWVVGHSAIGFGNYLLLNTTDASASGANVFNSTAPTSTVFSLGVGAGANTASATYVAYCFAEVAGYSKFGSYTGNGSTDGPFVFTGFRPAYVLYKGSSTSGGAWDIHDDTRSPSNEAVQTLFANTAGAEGGVAIDILSNGFKIRDTSANANSSGVTYIFMAFAENPFKYSLAR